MNHGARAVGATSADAVTDVDGYPVEPGARVELLTETRDGCVVDGRGLVEFLDPPGWVHWRADDGARHATRPSALRVDLTTATPLLPLEAARAKNALGSIIGDLDDRASLDTNNPHRTRR